MKTPRCFAPFLTVFCLAALAALVSCGRETANASKTSELFTLNYGSFEDEINLFNLTGDSDANTHIAMRDGLFYIANGPQKKVMQLTSYGDLLAVYYNEETTPPPAFATETIPETARKPPPEGQEGASGPAPGPPEGQEGVSGPALGALTTQKAIPYPFENPGVLAVDSEKNIYVADSLPPERIEHDPVNNLRLSQVVLRFSGSGAFMDYLGQRGPGGLAFPWIQNIYTTKSNELVVVCRTNTGMNVYWFSDTGFLLYMAPIEKRPCPCPRGFPVTYSSPWNRSCRTRPSAASTSRSTATPA